MKEPRVLSPRVQEFCAYVRLERGQGVRTAQEYGREVDRFGAFLLTKLAEPKAPDEAFAAATASDIRQFVMDLMGPRKWTQGSVRRALAALRAFYELQRREGRREDNPALDVPPPRLPKRLPHALPEADVARLLRSRAGASHMRDARGPVAQFRLLRDTAMLAVLYASGVRRAELIALNVGDVDTARRTMRVMGKGNKPRMVFLTASAATALEAYLQVRPQAVDDALFVRPGAHGLARRLSVGYFGQLFKAIVKRCGFEKHVTAHMLRHSFATHLLENGADIVTIKELLGHESLATTQIYTNVSLEHMRRSFEKAHPMDAMDDDPKV